MPKHTCVDDSSEDDILLFLPFSHESRSIKKQSRKATNLQGSDEVVARNRDERSFQHPSISKYRDTHNDEENGDISQVLGEKRHNELLPLNMPFLLQPFARNTYQLQPRPCRQLYQLESNQPNSFFGTRIRRVGTILVEFANALKLASISI